MPIFDEVSGDQHILETAIALLACLGARWEEQTVGAKSQIGLSQPLGNVPNRSVAVLRQDAAARYGVSFEKA